ASDCNITSCKLLSIQVQVCYIFTDLLDGGKKRRDKNRDAARRTRRKQTERADELHEVRNYHPAPHPLHTIVSALEEGLSLPLACPPIGPPFPLYTHTHTHTPSSPPLCLAFFLPVGQIPQKKHTHTHTLWFFVDTDLIF
uniref:BZIP domain-containing protein n=1 Tax=Lates calcarifer TaxID=8187 RepID=A0A4W6EMT1_LATCA